MEKTVLGMHSKAVPSMKEIKKLALTVINDNPTNTGLGRYAQVLFSTLNSLDVDLKFLSFSFGIKTLDSTFPGNVIREETDHVLTRVFPPIKAFPDFLRFTRSRIPIGEFRKVIEELSSPNEEGRITHYTNPGIYPFIFDDRTVVTVHDLIFTQKHPLAEIVSVSNNGRNINLYKRAPYVITFTHALKREIESEGFEGRVEIIYPPVSDFIHEMRGAKKIIRKKLNLPDDKILLLSVSTDSPNKNLKALKGMMELMDDRFKLVRVGPPIGNSITFNNVDDSTLNDIYNASDVLVFPSIAEGFGIPIVESFKVGLPVVASNIEVVREVAGDSAIVTEPTPVLLRKAVFESLDVAETLSTKGKERAALLFSSEAFTNKMVEFYGRIE